ncbi:hypothetical protein Z045_11585 [Rhodococcus pyridinivorans KG-16]|uniref:DUF3027 domain-containing protein n=1 Tax=Rhodococcus pyridinivorans KG-16 TaxID=1441730 RepID=A0A0V9UKK4_9NOCA|nr:DUF3027 domain-containing protein [Rhodococcus pyridinivorans]KSZ58528.1 hypothetical protein Z045_11585 [Rhodococcus pyridinivorans KG-16]
MVDPAVRSVLADAVDLARAALDELGDGGVGAYLGVTREDECSATHRFASELPGYRGWQWAVVVAAAPDSDRVTVSELVLLPGPDALVAPEWVPWSERIRPGDLGPGDLLAPAPDDVRLVPGYMQSGDPEVDETALEIGLGRKQVMSLDGRLEAAQRWFDSEYGPDSEMAKAAPSSCRLCGFYLPLAGSLRAAFGVCGNEFAADGHVVHAEYGCGAHSDTTLPTGAGSPIYEAFDDSAVEVVELGSAGSAPAESATTEVVSTGSTPTDSTDEPAAESSAPESSASESSASEPSPSESEQTD